MLGSLVPNWLTSRTLPAAHLIRELIDLYLSRVHPVRCLGFLHIPTFMERFRQDDSLYADQFGLIYAICALAAPFYYAKYVTASAMTCSRFHQAGRGWAASALHCSFATFGSPAVECLSTACLLHEHMLRVGDHAKAFLVSGIVARQVQILQLNMEHDNDVLCELPEAIPWAVKESRRRLFWASYLQDAFIECGIDQLRLIATDDIQIQLPCLEDYFIRSQPCLTEPLSLVAANGTSTDSFRRPGESSNLDLRAIYIRLMAIRSKILRYVKRLSGDVPWDTGGSQFQRLDDELAALQQSIPEHMAMTPANTYLYKSCGRLNVYFGVHILLAQTFNDLYRIGVAGLVFPKSASRWVRENAPDDFIKRCHVVCATNATHVAKLLGELYGCDREGMVDVAYAMHAQVCSGVLITTAASWRALSTTPMNLPGFDTREYLHMLESNVSVLQFLRQYMQVDAFFESANEALSRFRSAVTEQHVPSETESDPAADDATAHGPRQFSLDYILNPLGVYPIARTQAPEGHKPEQYPSPAETEQSASVTGEAEVASDAAWSDSAMISFPWNWDRQTPSLLDAMGYPSFLDDVFNVADA